jgi:hypothetical protein
MPDVFRAPGSSPNSTNTNYFGFTPTAPLDYGKPVPALAGSRYLGMAGFTDGPANSILVVESNLDVPWTQPADIPFDQDGDAPAIGGIHDNGFYAAMGDAEVLFFGRSFDNQMLRNVILIDDGTSVKLPDVGAKP